MMTIRKRLAAATLLILVTFAREGGACTCNGKVPPLQELDDSELVITGEVVEKIAIGEPYYPESYDVRVRIKKIIKDKSLKNKVGETVVVHTGSGNGDCGFRFESGRSYLVYAYESQGVLTTDGCTRTKRLDKAGDEVVELEGKRPALLRPSKAPEIVLLGELSSEKYSGFIFEVRNYLHERIFFPPSFKVQIFRDGQWESLAEEAERDIEMENLYAPRFHENTRELDRVEGLLLPSCERQSKYPWRIGFQYVTESSHSRGTRIYQSETWMWGPKIDPDTVVTKLTLKALLGLPRFPSKADRATVKKR